MGMTYIGYNLFLRANACLSNEHLEYRSVTIKSRSAQYIDILSANAECRSEDHEEKTQHYC